MLQINKENKNFIQKKLVQHTIKELKECCIIIEKNINFLTSTNLIEEPIKQKIIIDLKKDIAETLNL